MQSCEHMACPNKKGVEHAPSYGTVVHFSIPNVRKLFRQQKGEEEGEGRERGRKRVRFREKGAPKKGPVHGNGSFLQCIRVGAKAGPRVGRGC